MPTHLRKEIHRKTDGNGLSQGIQQASTEQERAEESRCSGVSTLNEVIEVGNDFYMLAGSSLSDDRTFVLKSGDMFGLFDHYGDIRPYGLGEQGIFYEGTRFLSNLDLK